MNLPPSQAKAALRAEVRERLAAMSVEARVHASAKICANLRANPVFQAAQAILFYAPLSSEPDLWPLLVETIPSGRCVGLPRALKDGSGYVAGQIRDLTQDVYIGRFNIREPAITCSQIPINNFDLILVPGMAFDRMGWRLGRGKGYYDRLLSDVDQTTLCGIAFDEQILKEIPNEAHDIRMHWVTTPEGLYNAPPTGEN